MPSVALVLRISGNGSAQELRGLALEQHFIDLETHFLNCEMQQTKSFGRMTTRIIKVVTRTNRPHRAGFAAELAGSCRRSWPESPNGWACTVRRGRSFSTVLETLRQALG